MKTVMAYVRGIAAALVMVAAVTATVCAVGVGGLIVTESTGIVATALLFVLVGVWGCVACLSIEAFTYLLTDRRPGIRRVDVKADVGDPASQVDDWGNPE